METRLSKHWHSLAAKDVERFLESDLEAGLDRFEVRRRQAHFGANIISAKKKKARSSYFFNNFTNRWSTSF